VTAQPGPYDRPAETDRTADAADLLARIAGGRETWPPTAPGQPSETYGRRRPDRTAADWGRLLRQLATALAASARKAGGVAVTTGRWLADVVVDAAPRIPVRDLETLRRQHPGLDREQLADTLATSASRATAAVGAGGGALTGVTWAAPWTLVTIPIQLAVEVAAVAVIEIKLVAELHEVYGVPVQGTVGQRGTAYALSWANRRGVNPLEPATITAALGVVTRRRVQRRLVVRAGRSLGTLAPLMAGAVFGAYSNRRQTLVLADSLRGDLRRRSRLVALPGQAAARLWPLRPPRATFRRSPRPGQRGAP
jgi:hypothetical protein